MFVRYLFYCRRLFYAFLSGDDARLKKALTIWIDETHDLFKRRAKAKNYTSSPTKATATNNLKLKSTLTFSITPTISPTSKTEEAKPTIRLYTDPDTPKGSSS